MIKQMVCRLAPSAVPHNSSTPARVLTLFGPTGTKVTGRKEVLMKTRIAIATMVLTVGPVGLCSAQQSEGGDTAVVERLGDLSLSEAQEAAIAVVRDEYAPRVEEAVDALKSVADE